MEQTQTFHVATETKAALGPVHWDFMASDRIHL